MSKTIKVEDQVYADLDEFRGKGETFSQALARVLGAAKTILTVQDLLGPSHYLMQRPLVDARAQETVDKREQRPVLPPRLHSEGDKQ